MLPCCPLSRSLGCPPSLLAALCTLVSCCLPALANVSGTPDTRRAVVPCGSAPRRLRSRKEMRLERLSLRSPLTRGPHSVWLWMADRPSCLPLGRAMRARPRFLFPVRARRRLSDPVPPPLKRCWRLLCLSPSHASCVTLMLCYVMMLCYKADPTKAGLDKVAAKSFGRAGWALATATSRSRSSRRPHRDRHRRGSRPYSPFPHTQLSRLLSLLALAWQVSVMPSRCRRLLAATRCPHLSPALHQPSPENLNDFPVLCVWRQQVWQH